MGRLQQLDLLYILIHIPIECQERFVRRCTSGVDDTDLELGQETAVRGDAVSSVLDHMESILPRKLELLHYVHYHECRREANSSWKRWITVQKMTEQSGIEKSVPLQCTSTRPPLESAWSMNSLALTREN